MLKEQKHQPLVKDAKHVWFQNDMPEWIAWVGRECYTDMESSDMDSSSDEDEIEDERLQQFAMDILDIFPMMCSLHLPRSYSLPCPYSYYAESDRSLPSPGEVREWRIKPLRCLSGHWRHENLTELIIEGLSLWITIPTLPNLATLVVYCHGNIALEFTHPESIGHTVKRMTVAGKPISFHKQQHEKLCIALKARDLQLIGDSGMCIALSACNGRILPDAATLLRQAKQDLKCRCRACPCCLGIGRGGKLDEVDPISGP